MVTFILKRLGLALITLWLLSVIVFVLGQVLPSDPGRSVLGPLAAPSAVRALDHQLGVDKPLLTQYWNWITHFPGTSTQYQAPIGPILTSALKQSLKLAVFAFVIVVPLGIFGGIVSALNFGKPIDRTISVVGQSARRCPSSCPGSCCSSSSRSRSGAARIRDGAPRAGFFTQIKYLILPAIPLVLVLFGYIARMARAGTVEALDVRLRADRDPQGAAARRDDPPPRPAQLAAADDHGDRDADRLPDRRAGRRRDAVSLQRDRDAHLQRRHQQRHPDARSLRAGHRHRVHGGDARRRHRVLAAQPADPLCGAPNEHRRPSRSRRPARSSAGRTEVRRELLRELRHSKTFIVGSAILLFWIICAIFGSAIAPTTRRRRICWGSTRRRRARTGSELTSSAATCSRA